MKPYQPNQSLIDGITILQALASSRKPVSNKELSGMLGIEATRVNRILKTYAYVGVTHRTKSRKYVPGPAMHVLAAQSLYGSGLLRSSMKALEGLTQYNYKVALGVLWLDKVSFLFHWEPGMPFEEAIGRVSLQPATRSGVGMVLLAEKSDNEIIELFEGRDIPGYNDVNALLQDIIKIRKDGYGKVLNNPSPVNIAVKIGNPAYAGIALAGEIVDPDMCIQKLTDIASGIEKSQY